MGTVFRVIPIVLHLLSLLCRAANGWRNLTVTVLLHPCSLPPVSKTSTLTKTNQQQDSQAPTPQSITIVETTTTLKRPGAQITEEMAETVSSLLISDTERGYRLSFASGVGGRVTGVTSDRLWSGERLWSGMDRKDSGDNVGRNITLIFSPSSLDEMKAGVGEEEGGKTDKQHAFIFRLNDGILGRHDWGGFLSSPMLGGTVVRDGGGSAGWGRVGILEDGMLVANGSVPQEVYDGFVNAARSGWDLEGGGEISTSGTVASVFCGVKSLSINGADVLPPPRTREDRNDKRNESGQKTDNIKQDQKSPRRQTLFEILEVGSSSPLILSLSTLSSGTSIGPGLDVIFFSPEPSLDIYFHLYVEFIANLLPQGTRNSTTRFWLERCTEGYWEGGECDVFTGGKGGDIGGGGRATLVVVNAHSNKQGMSLEFFERLYRGRRAVEGDKRGLLYLLHLNHEQPLTLDVGDLRNYYDVQKLREDYKRFDGVWRHYYHPKINMGDADGENGHRDAIVRYLPLGPALRDVKETDEVSEGMKTLLSSRVCFISLTLVLIARAVTLSLFLAPSSTSPPSPFEMRVYWKY